MSKSLKVDGVELSSDELVDANVVAKMTGFSKRTIQDMTSRRKIPCYKLGARAMRYRVSEIADWINSKKVA